MPRITLTDAFVNSPRCVPKSGRVEWFDKRETGLALRVSSTGHRSYVVITRYPHHPQPTRRSIDKLIGPPRDVEHAREIAREWRRQVKAGIDPRTEHMKVVAAQLRVKLFGEVLEEWLTKKVDKQVSARQTRQLLANRLPKRWYRIPIGDIGGEDIAPVIEGIADTGQEATAHVLFGALRNFFSWAVGTIKFGLKTSPMTELKPKALIGKKVVRSGIRRCGIESRVACRDQAGLPFRSSHSVAHAEWRQTE